MSKRLPQRDAHGFKVKKVVLDSHRKFEGNTVSIFEEESLGASYVKDYVNGLRRVTPYYFTFLTHCKQRWQDRKLIDVFKSEFRMKPFSYYYNAIANGEVKLNDQVANVDSVLRNGDLISHRIHRHEPPVTLDEIEIAYEDDEIMVINKPSGIPVHPTGRYRHNSITMIMKQEMGTIAHTCNRLDRLTSGIMFLGKTAKKTAKMVQQIKERNVGKVYIAKCKGKFPLGLQTVDKPLLTIDPRLTFNLVDLEDGKAAKTLFRRISYDVKDDTSIVKCMPLTGRTHQIRVHLQFIGYPIANDPVYSSPYVWGPTLGKGFLHKKNPEYLQEVSERSEKIGKTKQSTSWYYPEESGELLLEEGCEVCGSEMYSDPGVNDLILWLHAYRYYSHEQSWDYSTKMPKWSIEGHHRGMMKLAIEEAKKCDHTETAFNVGCIITDENGEIISRGYSREFEGNTHAEQCALMKLDYKVPPGSILYTTMEPCSERLSGNKPCVNRIIDLNGDVVTVFVGVVEPKKFIADNTGKRQLEDAGVNYLHIDGYEDEILALATR
ncbi:BA75_01612T0 [Komagataella pastoris]|uniref:tRNA pseudouridine(32) synthase n=1 Tax=Komagataella pastoris TaxID=4922 RepID=A0A1B2J6S3_PICPA|nr:BA75_01612T0 [Komagataella pastoris]